MAIWARDGKRVLRTLRLMDAVDPALRRRFAGLPVPETQFLCVYRMNNWQRVTPLADECSSLGWPVFLHALDLPHPALASVVTDSLLEY